ncbi:MAG TPA: hypothetical protein VM821_01315 [Abditibacteriaceae bacterium]|nr:hypothetical protein [Abditibacteriaceae bacterium]
MRQQPIAWPRFPFNKVARATASNGDNTAGAGRFHLALSATTRDAPFSDCVHTVSNGQYDDAKELCDGLSSTR